MSNFVDKKINRILILVAMEAEAQPLLDALQLSKVPAKVPFAPFQVFSGSYKGHHVTVVTNGKDARFKVDNVGTTPGMLMWIPAPLFFAVYNLSFPNRRAHCFLRHPRDQP
jgi:hypothetical protein